MDGVNVTDRSVPDPFAEAADVGGGVSLVAELRDHLVLPCCLHQGTDLVDGVSEWFLAVDVNTAFDGGHAGGGMGMIGRCDGDGVD